MIPIIPELALTQTVEQVGRARAEAIWSYPVPASPERPRRIIVEGVNGAEGFEPRAATLVGPETAARPQLAPVGPDLLSHFTASVFGAEERVSVTSNEGGLEIKCSGGGSVAGVILSAPAVYLPRGMNGHVRIAGSTTRAIAVSIVEAGQDAPDQGHAIFGPDGAAIPLAVIGAAGLPTSKHIVLVCPDGDATASIDSISIVPDTSAGSAFPIGTWVWRPEQWARDPAALIREASAEGVTEIALQFPIADGKVLSPVSVSRSIHTLGGSGIAVHAVEGDPAMIDQKGLRNAVSRVAALRAFARPLPPGASLAGLELDIEPYSRPAYRLDPTDVWRKWATAISVLAQTWGGKVSVVVPFWMLGEEGATEALASIRPQIASAIVMAYRTEAEALIRIGEPWLAWGAAWDVPIRIAVENGPILPEIHHTYVEAPTGTLTLLQAGPSARVELHAEPLASASGMRVYAYSHSVTVDPAKISFGGADNLRGAVARKALPVLQAWPSFAGFRIHGLWDYAELPDRKMSK